MKFIAVIQARLESTRLPRKVIREIYDGVTSLDLVYNRLIRSSFLDEIIFAIPDNEVNVELRNWLNKRDYRYEIGHETDLMSRYLKAVDNEQEVGIVRVTSDCPFVDPEIVDKAISKYKESDAQYVSTYTPPEESLFCNGSDIEIFSKTLLKSASEQYTSSRDKEHVTFQFWDGRMNIKKVNMNELLEGKDNYSDVE